MQARNRLDRSGRILDENNEVPVQLGAENKTTTNILAGNDDSLSYARNPPETIRIVYGTGNAHVAGGVFPKGVSGTIGDYYRRNQDFVP